MSVQINDFPVGLTPTAPSPEVASQGEQVARAAADAARRVAAEKAEVARQAMRAAADANRRASQAENAVQAREALLAEKGDELDPQSRSELQAEIDSGRAEAERLRDQADDANATAGAARQDARAAEDKRFEVETTANRVFKALGMGEPFQATRPVEDAFISDLIATRMAQLLGNPKLPNPRQAAAQDARRMAAALAASLANGAEVLEQLLEANSDPTWREAFLTDAQSHLGQLGHELAGGEEMSDLQEEAAQHALATLARSAELLDPAAAQRMAKAFVKGALDGRSGLEDPERFGQRLRDALNSGQSGGTFALELALAFGGAGDQAAAEQVLEALCRSLAEARARFDQATRVVEALDAELLKYLSSPSAWTSSGQLLDGMLRFEDGHLAEYALYEQTATALGAMLAGAARVMDRAREGSLPAFKLLTELLRQVGLVLARAERLVFSTAGEERLTEALDAQGRGARTWLDVLPDVARGLDSQRLRAVGREDAFERTGKSFLENVGQGMVQMLAPQLLSLRVGGRQEELGKLLKTTVGKNPALFGLAESEAGRLVVTFTAMTHGKRASSVRESLAHFLQVGNPALRGLALVMAGTIHVASSSGNTAEIADALRAVAGQLDLGRAGLGTVASMLKRPTPTPAMAGILVLVGTALLANVGAVTPKVAEAYSALASGVTGKDFSADADFLTDVGSMLSTLCGARLADAIATAGLTARAKTPEARKPTPRPAEDLATLRAYLQRAA